MTYVPPIASTYFDRTCRIFVEARWPGFSEDARAGTWFVSASSRSPRPFRASSPKGPASIIRYPKAPIATAPSINRPMTPFFLDEKTVASATVAKNSAKNPNHILKNICVNRIRRIVTCTRAPLGPVSKPGRSVYRQTSLRIVNEPHYFEAIRRDFSGKELVGASETRKEYASRFDDCAKPLD